MPFAYAFPSHNSASCLEFRSMIGLCTGKSNFFAALMNASFHSPIFSPFHGAMAPSYRLNLLSGMMRSGSRPSICENPSQVGQAPNGLLKENKLGTGSSKVIPSNSNLLLKGNFFFELISKNIVPSPS